MAIACHSLQQSPLKRVSEEGLPDPTQGGCKLSMQLLSSLSFVHLPSFRCLSVVGHWAVSHLDPTPRHAGVDPEREAAGGTGWQLLPGLLALPCGALWRLHPGVLGTPPPFTPPTTTYPNQMVGLP